jgi:hypothetical protein
MVRAEQHVSSVDKFITIIEGSIIEERERGGLLE